MSVRGSKNKITLYIAGLCSIVFVILLYHNASQRLEEMEKSYKICHLNEESLSAQLQVNLEYKVRLEKSLQQEKSEHAQAKEDVLNKLEEERQARERENLESMKKFNAEQQKYKFLQSQHEDLEIECKKLKLLQSSEREERERLQKQVISLNDELKLMRERKEMDKDLLKAYNGLVKENEILKNDKMKLMRELSVLETNKMAGTETKRSENLFFNSSLHKAEEKENILQQPELGQAVDRVPSKSSTLANKSEHELFLSGNNVYVNTSTPMINPDAVLSQDKILNAAAAPVPQPQHETNRNFPAYDNKENVGAKPEEMSRQKKENDAVLSHAGFHAPDIMHDFGHVPAIQEYKERMRLGFDRNNNNGGEVGDEGEPLVRGNVGNNKQQPWRGGGGEVKAAPFARQSAGNDMLKNQVYYQAEYDHRKEEGEDDDDADPLEYNNFNEKNQQEEKPNLGGVGAVGGSHVKIPFEDRHESVMIQPK